MHEPNSLNSATRSLRSLALPSGSPRCVSRPSKRSVSQVELAGRLDVTQGAISELEPSEDVQVSTLRQYLEALGARLELVAVFDDDARRVPVHLGNGSAA